MTQNLSNHTRPGVWVPAFAGTTSVFAAASEP
jgi:hypothetical protein